MKNLLTIQPFRICLNRKLQQGWDGLGRRLSLVSIMSVQQNRQFALDLASDFSDCFFTIVISNMELNLAILYNF